VPVFVYVHLIPSVFSGLAVLDEVLSEEGALGALSDVAGASVLLLALDGIESAGASGTSPPPLHLVRNIAAMTALTDKA